MRENDFAGEKQTRKGNHKANGSDPPASRANTCLLCKRVALQPGSLVEVIRNQLENIFPFVGG
jgi:hypothetical protein